MSEYRGIHDIGGQTDEVFAVCEHDYQPWEKRVHALRELPAQKGLLLVDELRRTIEGMGEERYKRLSYYEQWVWAIGQVMLARGVIADSEFGSRLAQIRARHPNSRVL